MVPEPNQNQWLRGWVKAIDPAIQEYPWRYCLKEGSQEENCREGAGAVEMLSSELPVGV